MKHLHTLIAACAILGASAISANATPITGAISLDGAGFTPTGGSTLSTATGIAFDPNAFFVGAATGNLLTFVGNVGSIQNFTFSPFTSISDFYTVSNAADTETLTFDLTSMSISTQNDTFLSLIGTGTLDMLGFDPTSGILNFTATVTGSGDDVLFSWTADGSAVPSPVPEPASLLILGAGLVGIASFVRRRKNRA